MLTLDVLARMAARMSLDEPRWPFRCPDAALRARQVTLPTVAEEARAALRLFVFVTGVASAVLTVAGVTAVHGCALIAGAPLELDGVASTALTFLGLTAALVAPFTALGLALELRRFSRARRTIGALGVLTSDGALRSEDGRHVVRLSRRARALD